MIYMIIWIILLIVSLTGLISSGKNGRIDFTMVFICAIGFGISSISILKAINLL